MEAERSILERLPPSEKAAVDIERLLEGTPTLTRTVAQNAIKKLTETGVVRRTGRGKKGSPYRYFRAIAVSATTQITSYGRNRNGADADDVAMLTDVEVHG
jgi:predicted transcriptional regulator